MSAKANAFNSASLTRIAKRRSRIYGILAAVYTGPVDETFLGLLRGLKVTNDTSLPVQKEQLSGGLKQLREWLENNSALPDGTVSSQLSPEYIRLFRGVNRRNSPLPPYESVYLEGRLFGDSTGTITEMFRQYSLEAPSNEPPDHISLELDFMRLLCQSEAEAWSSAAGGRDLLDEEGQFLQGHMLKWVPALCEQIRKFDTTGFYKGVADITEGWINYDLAEISHLIAETGKPGSA